MIEAEGKWARSSCSPQPDLKAVIADDFQGTSTDGHRYDKAQAIATDPKTAARGCQLGEVKVRFFGDAIAIAYGAENLIRKAEDGPEAKRCQVWTDTWLKRNGQWQIVAAQDTVIPVLNDPLFLNLLVPKSHLGTPLSRQVHCQEVPLKG